MKAIVAVFLIFAARILSKPLPEGGGSGVQQDNDSAKEYSE